MNVTHNIEITLSKEEREAVAKVNAVIAEFVNENLCDKMSCCSCPLHVFCPRTDADDFEEILNDIANIE